MPITIDYIEPPAIVRRHKVSMGPQAQGEFGAWLDDCIEKISEQLDASREWQGIRMASANLSSKTDNEILDVFSLNRVPPKRTYMARARFHRVGRGKPMPYKLDDEE